jgi:hypothetical protein
MRKHAEKSSLESDFRKHSRHTNELLSHSSCLKSDNLRARDLGAKMKTQDQFGISKARRFQSRALGVLTAATITFLLGGCSSATAVLNGEVILDSGLIETEIESGVLNQSGISVTADCPDPMSGKVGDVRQCVIEDDFGTVAIVRVTIQNTDGYIVWEVQ